MVLACMRCAKKDSVQLGCVSCLQWSKSVSNGQNRCTHAGWRQKPFFACQYIVLGDLGVHKSTMDKLRMMTKRNFSGDEKSFDSGPTETQRTLKQPQSLDLRYRTLHKLMSLKPYASQHLEKLNEGSVQGKSG